MKILGACLVLCCSTHALSGQTSRAPVIGPVKDLSDFGMVAGCSFWRNKAYEQPYFLRNYGENAVVNINGRDEAIELVESTENWKDKNQKRFIERYVGDVLEVTLRYNLREVCAPDECTVVRYDGVMEVRVNRRKSTMKLTGQCGS